MTVLLLLRLLTWLTPARLLLSAAAVLGSAWFWTLWDYGRNGRCRAPVRWYTAYVPPHLPGAVTAGPRSPAGDLDLDRLNQEYSPITGRPKSCLE